ncbi:MAG: 50S ribosome-binding GTPase [Phycisphaeraceae bacterium]|nr:50S ribosome-binding GTPase [Phycisphaeraceae bacterium]
MSNWTDTIVARSSPPGHTTRTLIRISGPKAEDIIARLLDHPITEPRRLTQRRLILDPDSSPALPVLACFFEPPACYTGEPTAEIQFPGNPELVRRVLDRCVQLGARPAEAGEFTFRAMIHGRLDLTEVEGIGATIAAENDAELAAAATLRQGALSQVVNDIADRVTHLLALVEAGIDFTDQEDVTAIGPDELAHSAGQTLEKLRELIQRSVNWQAVTQVPAVVLAGPPSSGKSTLFNALLGRERSVTHHQPGTTRDVLVEEMNLPTRGPTPMRIQLIDMAGLDEPLLRLDRQVQEQARTTIEQADLVILLEEAHDGPLPGFLIPSHERRIIRIRPRIDQQPPARSPSVINVCALDGRGLPELLEAMAQRLGAGGPTMAQGMMALQPRHAAALQQAADRLAQSIVHAGGADRSSPPAPRVANRRKDAGIAPAWELVAFELRRSLDALGSITGRVTPDDIIGEIFSRFCIGK